MTVCGQAVGGQRRHQNRQSLKISAFVSPMHPVKNGKMTMTASQDFIAHMLFALHPHPDWPLLIAGAVLIWSPNCLIGIKRAKASFTYDKDSNHDTPPSRNRAP
jgi:hypothetical protein